MPMSLLPMPWSHALPNGERHRRDSHEIEAPCWDWGEHSGPLAGPLKAVFRLAKWGRLGLVCVLTPGGSDLQQLPPSCFHVINFH